ncbi:GGDEF domain-containing protein [Iodobacter fluviatilis]|uniref:diguanylate cyclase n=1 Tax=Iodobacter fluviatilis TaxID=537 RepID=A0A377Q1I0_9NEIS|nr:GGDEF domain-containing protein [Iodobacter fluviatilis]TCU90017.1 diguanylate cyclase (GGDEF)-like protein [Iodobacter fluviatilis]STQ89044.1 Stalked cell differentiation-controlling protein [Iodobacter fluviatilis]
MQLEQLLESLDLSPFDTREAALALAAQCAAADKPRALKARHLAAKALGRRDTVASTQEYQRLLPALRRYQLWDEYLAALDECGGHAMVQGNVNEAIHQWSACLEEAMVLQNGFFAVQALLGIGKAFWVLNDFKSAHHYHCLALEFALPLQDKASLAGAYLCLIADMLAADRYTEAGIALRLAHLSVLDCKNRHWQAEYLLFRGRVYLEQRQLALAEADLTVALLQSTALSFSWVASQVEFQLFKLYCLRQDGQEAAQHLANAEAQAKAIQATSLLERFAFGTYQQHKAQGDSREALKYYRIYLEYYEQNHGRACLPRLAQSTARRLQRLENRIELTQRKQENALLCQTLNQQSAQLDSLSRAALSDPLTGLANRRHLEQQLDRLDQQARLPMSLLIVDIDYFKQVNDAYGHAIGDLVLQRMASVLQFACRNNELIARYGGEEFYILLPQVLFADARQIAERLCAMVENHDWDSIARGLHATVSIGLASNNGHWLPCRTLALEADAALYEAKAAGRNCVRWRITSSGLMS